MYKLFPEDDIDEPFNIKLARHMEFLELSSNLPSDMVPSYIKSKYNKEFLHQEVVKRFMTIYDRCFIIHPPGKGKTCTAVGIVEEIRKNGSIINKRNGYPKHTYILEKSPSVINDIKNQIVNICAKDVYNIQNSTSVKGQKRLISVALQDNYTIETYKKFSNVKLTNESIKEKYSDCIFIIDEAHNLNGEFSEDSDMSKKDIKRAYEYIKNVLDIAERTKVVVMTATPLVNSPSEVNRLLNLVLDKKDQLEERYDPLKNPEHFSKITKGLISYVQDTQNKIDIVRNGEILPFKLSDGSYSNSIIYRINMQGLQASVYSRWVNDPKGNHFFQKSSLCSNFVLPDGTLNYDNEKWIKEVESDKYVAVPELQRQFKNNLKNISSKFDFIIQNELNPCRTIEWNGKTMTLPGKGCAFYYTEYVAGGAIPFSLCLESYGFERYNSKASPFSYYIDDDGVKKRKINISKRPRYIFVNTKNVEFKLDNFKELFNSEENRWGEYVQIFIGSQLIKDGINLFNTVRIYRGPSWNPASMEQAERRPIRAVSHDVLNRETLKLIEEKFGDAPSKWKSRVDIWNISSCLDVNNKHVNSINSTDDYLYVKIVEEKSLKIQKTLNILKNNAFDRYINTPEKLPFELTSENIVFGTWDNLYSTHLIDDMKTSIINLFRTGETKYHISDIIDVCYKNIIPFQRRKNYVLKAIYELVIQKSVIRDKLNYKNWLRVNGEYIFLTKEYPNTLLGNLSDNYYCNPIIIGENSIKDNIIEYCENNIEPLNLMDYEDRNNITNRVIIENFIYNSSHEEIINDPVIKKIINNVLFISYKPLSNIREISRLMSLASTKKGVKAGNESLTKIKGMKFLDVSENGYEEDIKLPIVVFHIIDGDMRLIEIDSFENKTNNWRNVYFYEEPAYRHIIDEINKNKRLTNKGGVYYGKIGLYGNLIVMKFENLDNHQSDKRLKNKGKDIISIIRKDLVGMFIEENVPYPRDEKSISMLPLDLYEKDETKKIKAELKKQNVKIPDSDLEDSVYELYLYIMSNYTKEQYSEMFLNMLREKGKIL